MTNHNKFFIGSRNYLILLVDEFSYQGTKFLVKAAERLYIQAKKT